MDITTILEYVGGGSIVVILVMTAICCCRGNCVSCCNGCNCSPRIPNPNITDKGNGIKEYHINY